MNETTESPRKPAVITPGAGRVYDMGRMKAVFKADGAETKSNYSVSEWWLEADTAGPGVHHHPEDHVFVVIEGSISVFLDGEWIACDKGSYILLPGGTPPTFKTVVRPARGLSA